jgi:hypothetical protein
VNNPNLIECFAEDGPYSGITLMDLYAGMAMLALVGAGYWTDKYGPKTAFDRAVLMMQEREKRIHESVSQ